MKMAESTVVDQAPDPEFADERWLSARFSIPTKTLQRLRHEKRGAPWVRPGGGRKVLYSVAAFREWVTRSSGVGGAR